MTPDTPTPGTVTTLGQLRPGDVATIIRGDGTETEPIIVAKDRKDVYVGLLRPDGRSAKTVGCPVRYLGRGRIEPARIVMDGEADLATQVATLRAALASAIRSADMLADQQAMPDDS